MQNRSSDRAADPRHGTTLPEAREITKARARDLRTLLSKYIRRHLPPAGPRVQPPPEPPRTGGAYARLLPFLGLIPWLLGLLFGISFFWDFDAWVFAPFGYALSLQGLLRILSVSGLIGFFTNWLAITMLFQPRQRRPLFGQGLIPAQRDRVIFRLARAISEELINADIIKQRIEESQVIPRYREMALRVTHGVLEDPDFRHDIKNLTADYANTVLTSEAVRQRMVEFTIERVEQYAGKGLSGLALKTYRFLNEEDFQRRIDQAVRELPLQLDAALDGIDHMLDQLPPKIEAHSAEIEDWATRVILGFVENIDVYGMIIENMRKYDEQQLERLLKNTSNEQLNYIKYLGGVLGVFGGFIIWKPMLALIVFGALGLVLYLVDEAWYRMRRDRNPA